MRQGGDLRDARLHGVHAGHQMVEQHAETVDVAPNRRSSPSKEFGSQVKRSAGETSRYRSSGPVPPRNPSARRVHSPPHHVVGLDVAMQKTGTVHGRNRVTELDTDVDGLGPNRTPCVSITCSSVRPLTNSIHKPTRSSIRSAP